MCNKNKGHHSLAPSEMKACKPISGKTGTNYTQYHRNHSNQETVLKPLHKRIIFPERPKASKEIWEGIHIGGVVTVSAVVLNAVDSIHKIGINTNAEKKHKRK